MLVIVRLIEVAGQYLHDMPRMTCTYRSLETKYVAPKKDPMLAGPLSTCMGYRLMVPPRCTLAPLMHSLEGSKVLWPRLLRAYPPRRLGAGVPAPGRKPSSRHPGCKPSAGDKACLMRAAQANIITCSPMHPWGHSTRMLHYNSCAKGQIKDSRVGMQSTALTNP